MSGHLSFVSTSSELKTLWKPLVKRVLLLERSAKTTNTSTYPFKVCGMQECRVGNFFQLSVCRESGWDGCAAITVKDWDKNEQVIDCCLFQKKTYFGSWSPICCPILAGWHSPKLQRLLLRLMAKHNSRVSGEPLGTLNRKVSKN